MGTSDIAPYTTTGIGSLPHRNAADAAALTLKSLDIPFWPQLPNVSFLEQMVPQYSEGMPTVRIDHERQVATFERDEEQIARFHETCGPDTRIAISEDYARGFYSFMEQVKQRGRMSALKGHITGPLTFTLGLKDAAGRLMYFDEELREIALMLLSAKARWQVDQMKPHASRVIIFIDEPILSALGSSAYMGVDPAEAARMLGVASEAVRQAGGMAGIHCCGRADWPLVLGSGVDIMNFDAYAYGETLAIYPDEVTAFLKRGGYLAWGIVPTSDDIARETEQSIVALFHKRMDELSARIPEDLLRSRIILTPSCGTGSRSVAETTKVFQILMRLKEELA
jgi:hypothetical protein